MIGINNGRCYMVKQSGSSYGLLIVCNSKNCVMPWLQMRICKTWLDLANISFYSSLLQSKWFLHVFTELLSVVFVFSVFKILRQRAQTSACDRDQKYDHDLRIAIVGWRSRSDSVPVAAHGSGSSLIRIRSDPD